MGPESNLSISRVSKGVKLDLSRISQSCRVCMKWTNRNKPLFLPASRAIVDKLSFCTGLQFTEEEGLPSQICIPCLDDLVIAYKLKTNCINSDLILRKTAPVKVKRERIDAATDRRLEEILNNSVVVKAEEVKNVLDILNVRKDLCIRTTKSTSDPSKTKQGRPCTNSNKEPDIGSVESNIKINRDTAKDGTSDSDVEIIDNGPNCNDELPIDLDSTKLEIDGSMKVDAWVPLIEKRGRGRPRNGSSTVTNTPKQPLIKKGRGRPRKYKKTRFTRVKHKTIGNRKPETKKIKIEKVEYDLSEEKACDEHFGDEHFGDVEYLDDDEDAKVALDAARLENEGMSTNLELITKTLETSTAKNKDIINKQEIDDNFDGEEKVIDEHFDEELLDKEDNNEQKSIGTVKLNHVKKRKDPDDLWTPENQKKRVGTLKKPISKNIIDKKIPNKEPYKTKRPRYKKEKTDILIKENENSNSANIKDENENSSSANINDENENSSSANINDENENSNSTNIKDENSNCGNIYDDDDEDDYFKPFSYTDKVEKDGEKGQLLADGNKRKPTIFSLTKSIFDIDVTNRRYRKRKTTRCYRRALYCDVCDIKFPSGAECAQHMKTHETSRVCEICGIYLTNPSAMYVHVRSHEPPPHECAHCGHRSQCKRDLTKHIRRVHLRNLPRDYQCQYCPKNYQCSSGLSAHIQNVHEQVRKYGCDLCGKRFFYKDKLRMHLDSHYNIKRYKCVHCLSCFTRITYWKKHLLDRHGIVLPQIKGGRRRKNYLSTEDHQPFSFSTTYPNDVPEDSSIKEGSKNLTRKPRFSIDIDVKELEAAVSSVTVETNERTND